MAYTINRYSGATLVVKTASDITTDLTFVGKNYGRYGEIQNENFFVLLENFMDSPSNLQADKYGMIPTTENKIYDGTKFKTTGGAEVLTYIP